MASMLGNTPALCAGHLCQARRHNDGATLKEHRVSLAEIDLNHEYNYYLITFICDESRAWVKSIWVLKLGEWSTSKLTPSSPTCWWEWNMVWQLFSPAFLRHNRQITLWMFEVYFMQLYTYLCKMITIIALATTSILSYSYHFFFMVRQFKITLLATFKYMTQYY